MLDATDKPATLHKVEVRGSHTKDGELTFALRLKLSMGLTPEQEASLPDDVVKMSLTKDSNPRSIYVEYMEEVVEMHGAKLGLSPQVTIDDDFGAQLTLTIDADLPSCLLEALGGMVLQSGVALSIQDAQQTLPGLGAVDAVDAFKNAIPDGVTTTISAGGKSATFQGKGLHCC
jgi:hypothetical protein